MRAVRDATEAEVVATFLRGELDSARWTDSLRRFLREDGVDPRIVTDPDVDDADANAYRALLLERHRGWLSRRGLFGVLPQRIDWTLVALSPDEVLEIRYIDWDWWLRISDGTRDARVAAERLRRGEVPGGDPESDREIAARLRSAQPPPELIAVSPPDRSKLVLLEGHVRLTAYALFPAYLPDELELFLGSSDEIDGWSLF
jgi:hypothetical protein